MFSTPNNPQAPAPSLAEIVREETDDGRLIVRFLIDVMQGELEDSKPCHRLDAARQLLNLGFHPAQSFINANTPATQQRNPQNPAAVVAPTSLHQDLANLILKETDNGRTAIRFLVDVMQDLIPDFKPHHRLSAAKELLSRGFDTPTPGHAEIPNTASPVKVNNAIESAPAESPAEPEPPKIRVIPGHGNRYETEYGPFNFETYDDADYDRDCYGDDAVCFVLSGKEAKKAACEAVYDFRFEIYKAAKASGQDSRELEHLATVPADAPLPKDIYGYQVLLKVFGTEPAARVVAKAAADYHRKVAMMSNPHPQPPDGPPPPDNLWDQPEDDPKPSTPRPDAPKLNKPKPAALEPPAPEPTIQAPRVPSRPDADAPYDWSDYPTQPIYERFTAPIIP